MTNRPPDILKQLADEARRYRVARMLPAEGELTEDQVRLVAEDFASFIDSTGLTIAKVAKGLGKGFTAPVLSQFKAIGEDGRVKYAGDASKVARAINHYMEVHAQQAETWRPDGFISTEVARNIITIVQNAVFMRTIAVISGDSGRGKTMALVACHRNHVGSVYLRIRRDRRTSAGLARVLCKELNIKGATTGAKMIDEAIAKLQGTRRPLMIDEAHQLTPDALELIRDIHDECEDLPIILCGTYDINDKTADGDIFYGQFSSRIGLRYDINEDVRGKGGSGGGGGDRNSRMTKPIHSLDEIMALFTDDKLRLTDDGFQFLFKLANVEGQGAIRLVKQVTMAAARAYRGKPITEKVLRSFLAKMHGHARVSRQVNRAIEQLEVKSA